MDSRPLTRRWPSLTAYGKSTELAVAVYHDFRKMLEQETALDAVLCGTPDHIHSYVSLLAMKAGKHVCFDSPLSSSLPENTY